MEREREILESFGSWLDAKEVRRDGPGSYGIIYLTGRETKQTKHCRGVASLRKQRPREREEWDEELKLGTKVLTFVPWKVFRIMAMAERKTKGKGGRNRKESCLCDLYLAKVSELLNFPGYRKKGGEGNDGHDGEEFLRERACTVIKPFSNEDWSVN